MYMKFYVRFFLDFITVVIITTNKHKQQTNAVYRHTRIGEVTKKKNEEDKKQNKRTALNPEL